MTTERLTESFGLGRRVATDERDHRFLMRMAAPAPPVLPNSRYWITGPTLDQGRTGSCVGHGWKGFLMAIPFRTMTGPSAFDIYDGCTKIDEWPDNDNDLERQFGTSVRAGAKVLSSLGYIAQYLWAFDLQVMLEWLLTKGPVVIGVNWYTGMFRPDSKGFIAVSGSLAGGHCVLLTGANRYLKKIRFKNSWGNDWGQKGSAWLSFDDMERLIRENGEVCCGVEQKLIQVPS